MVAIALLLGCGSWAVHRSGVLYITSEPVTFVSADGAKLVGEIVMPRHIDKPLPAMIVVHGSGRMTSRDVRGWARGAIDAGFIALIYDKRGVGRSEGAYDTIHVPDSQRMLSELADDATAAWRVLRERPEVDASRIGFIGGSQAGWTMPLAASRCESPAFVVAVSGPTVTYGQEIEYSRLTGDDPGAFGKGELSDVEIDRRMAAFGGPHGYDPMPVLRELDVPSLWLLGGADRSVPTALCASNIERLRASGNEHPTVITYPEHGHNLPPSAYWADMTAWLRGVDVLD